MRKKQNHTRHITPDRVYQSQDVAKFINYIMKKGKKNIAEKILYGALDKTAEKLNLSQMEVFTNALSNASPTMTMMRSKSRFAARSNAIALNKHRSRMLGIRWILESASERSPYKMVDKLAAELVDAAQDRGNAVKKNQAHYDLIVKSVVTVPNIPRSIKPASSTSPSNE